MTALPEVSSVRLKSISVWRSTAGVSAAPASHPAAGDTSDGDFARSWIGVDRACPGWRRASANTRGQDESMEPTWTVAAAGRRGCRQLAERAGTGTRHLPSTRLLPLGANLPHGGLPLSHHLSSLPSGTATIPVADRAYALSLEASFGRVRGSACGLSNSSKSDHDRGHAENKAATQQRDHQRIPKRPAVNESWEVEAVQPVE